jgi:hypothetical protein
MGNTTIIELNHDLSQEIFYNDITEKRFLEQIRRQLSAFEYNGKDILGGKVIWGFHRSGFVYDLWEKFKESLRKYLLRI